MLLPSGRCHVLSLRIIGVSSYHSNREYRMGGPSGLITRFTFWQIAVETVAASSAAMTKTDC